MAGKIKFVKRGQALAATILEDDLAAHEWGSEVPNQVDKVRAQDLELPHEVNVLYINSGADYQQGTQKSERQTGSGLSVMSIPLPVVMSDTKAKQVADVNHYNAWVGRTTYSLQLSRKWSKLEPTDVIDVVYGTTTFRMRITKKDEAKPGIIKLECVAEDSAIYSQTGLGAGISNIPTQVVTIPVQTLAVFLDIPMLRDNDNDAGLYFAACGHRDGWGGCALFKSVDGGSTYSRVLSLSNETTIGYSTSSLDNFYGGNTFDELNSVTIQIVSGALSSASEALVLNNENYAILGSELIQFKNAELISTNTYKLTGLLRGRKGTEWAMGLHSIGEVFVLASITTMRRINLQTSDINLSRFYKPVTFGMSLQQTATQAFMSTGVALECYSPVLVKGGKDNANNIVISWTRRGRISAEWRDNADIPLGEASESYEVDIYSDSTFTSVVRTLTSTSQTVTYTSAQQVTDFGTNPLEINVKVYQLSAIVGRGYPAQKTLDIPLPAGTIYATDFTEYTIGVAPSDWTERWSTGDFSTTVEVGGDDQILKFNATAASRKALSWDDAGTFVNGEILAKIKPFGRDSNDANFNLARLFLRGAGASESGYFSSFSRDLSSIGLSKYVAGTASVITEADYPFTLGDWQWVKLRIVGASLKLKVWLDGDIEPTSWTIEVSDSSVTAAGWSGVGSFDAADDIEVDSVTITVY